MKLELSQLVDALPGLAWTALPDPDARVDFLNHRWCEYTGLGLDHAIGLGWQSAIHPDDLARLLQAWRSCLDSGQPGELEARVRRHDGEYRRFLLRANPIRDEAGSISRWLGINTDVEDRKRAEEALAASERELRCIVNAIPTLAWSADPDGSADFVNQRWLDYTGLSAERAQGWGWRAAIHSDDVEGLVGHWQACLASGTSVEAEARLRRFDGSHRWFLFRANPLRDEAGHILKWYGTNIDIEDRRRVEETLRARELSWRQIVDSIPGLVATTSGSGEVEFLNRQTLEYFGKATEDLKNWALIGVVHPDDLPRVIEARQKTLETGQIYEVEHRCLGADGVYRWFQVRGIPVRDQQNEITAWYLLLTDIDDRKRAEEALRSNERNLSLMLNAVPTYIHVLGSDGSVLYANQAVLDYMGITLEDVRKKDYRARFFHPEDVERLREERREALARGVPFENEQRVLRKDGTYRWFLVLYNPVLDEQGGIDRWYVVALDIEDRKRAEAQLEQAYLGLADREAKIRRLVDANIIGIVFGDLDDRIVEANDAFLRMIGYDREDLESGGLRWTELTPPEWRERNSRTLTELKSTGTVQPFEKEYFRKDGSRVPVLIGAALFKEAGNGGVVFVLDLTELKRAQDALFGATLEARVGERTRIARELHDTLLQSFQGLLLRFQGALDLLPGQPAQAREALSQALDEAEQAVTEGRDAVQGLRAFAVETNDLALAFKSFGEGLAADQKGARAATVTVEVEGAPRNLDPILRDEMYRIGCEAIRNAFRHAAARRVEVELRYDERQLRLRARDDGKGIDPAYLGEKGRTGHFGLRGMRERAELIGGTLTIWSAPHAGTEVELIIPGVRAYTSSPARWSWATQRFAGKGAQSD